MLKVLSFLTKSEGMEMQAFIDYYDNKHVPLSAAWRPLPSLRRYLVRGKELTKEGGAVDFDVVTEQGFPDLAVFFAWMAQVLRTRRWRAGRCGRGEVSRSVADQGLCRRGTRHIRVSYAVRGARSG